MKPSFDRVIENRIQLSNEKIKTIGQLLFERLPGRKENSQIILSHIDTEFIEISLTRLRYIVLNLLKAFGDKKIRKSQTVVLLTFHGCNEMITALYFIALASAGCRVFMPMYFEAAEFSDWMELTQASHIIIPEGEVMSLTGHEPEKSSLEELKNISRARGIKIWDSLLDFGLPDLLGYPEGEFTEFLSSAYNDAFSNALPDDEVMVVTTSGTSGRSRLVVYTHKAYYLNCSSWEAAGFYNSDVLGGTGFTPLFTHTMGIRAFINALWTGVPVCLIITEWFFKRPEVVRYLLLKMKPAHITGGPAVYNAFIELFRTYPELKSGLNPFFKTLVSSGAQYNPVTAKEIYDATGLYLQNAYGTTETQQVLSTLLSDSFVLPEGTIPMGKPLPGVSIGLTETGTDKNQYMLFVKSVFGSKCCLTMDGQTDTDYFETGDVVMLGENEDLIYLGRAYQDYFKDSFGVKIPLPLLRNYYRDLFYEILHAEFYPIINFPGISALLFIEDATLPSGPVEEIKTLKRFAGIVEGANNRLIHLLEAFEFQHRHICRIAIINQAPPHTGKGTISVNEITKTYNGLIDRLRDTRKNAAGIEITEKLYEITDRYTRYISPQIGTMLTALKINAIFHKGRKDTLLSYIRGKEKKILDLVGGYGTNLMGHNHPEIVKSVREFVSNGKVAICNQVSIQQITGMLAEKLNLLIGAKTGRSFQVLLANSGSEAVEIALHHACFEWKKKLEKFRDQQMQLFGSDKELDFAGMWKHNQKIIDRAIIRVIAVSQAFHGHSTGARSVLGNDKKRNYFRQLSHIEPLFIDDRESNWKSRLDSFILESQIILRRISRDSGHTEIVPYPISTIIAAIAEPVIGEGGVRLVKGEFLKKLASYEFPLISDEIQCGLGRSGSIPECDCAQYYLFGKALGGGLEKISAVMIDSSRFGYDFSENYVSTFSNGELASHVALRTLQVIEANEISRRALEIGSYLHEHLHAIRKKYPAVILDINGKGLMQAILFNPGCAGKSILLRMLFQTEKAGYLFAAWFFNRHSIRILPTLSAPHSLRIEPSAYFNKAEVRSLCHALEELCQLIIEGRTYKLFSFLMDDDPFMDHHEPGILMDHYSPLLESPVAGAMQVAFIAHFVFPLKEIRMLEPDMGKASDTGLRIFFKRMQVLMEMKPVKIMATHLFNKKVHFTFWAIPLDSSELEYLHKSGKRRYVVSKIQEAVDMASLNGAKVISLGGYTSILTNNGLSLAESPGSRIITGNTLTAASGLMHLGNTIRKRPEFRKLNTIAIIGASGNIGRIITEMLYEQVDICAKLILVSRSEKRETSHIDGMKNNQIQKVKLQITANLSDIVDADIIIICTNTNDPIILPHHIAHDRPVLISDLSVPSAITEEVKKLPNVTALPFSAYVSLPEDREVVISSYSPPGTVFCCAGEAILLALESCNDDLKGRIMPEAVRTITKLASRHGFFSAIESIDSFKNVRS